MADKDREQGYVGTSRENDFLAGVDAVAGSRAEGRAEAESVGQRVARLREQKGLSLQDVARRTGLAEDALAEIEKGASSPPLGVLVKLGKALDMKLGTLIAGGGDRPYTVVRVDDRKDMSRYPHTRETSYGYSYQALAPMKQNRSMEPFLVTLREPTEQVAASTHDGQEFIFVLEGEMEAIVGEASERLGPGDSIYYDSTVPHLLRPAGGGPTTILAVIYSQDR
jgi:transcriptional regulator with XRE-family HTH domain